MLRGPEVEPNAEVFARSVQTVNCREAIGAHLKLREDVVVRSASFARNRPNREL